MAFKWSPKQCDKDMANSNQVVCFISCQGICAQIEWLNLKFQFTTTNVMSVAAKLSDLVDKMSEANLQMEDHTDVPPQSAKDLQELEALGSSPSTHNIGPWPGGHHPVALIQNIV